MLVLKKDVKDNAGSILLKANTPYMPKGEDIVNGKKYLVYDSEIAEQEVLLHTN